MPSKLFFVLVLACTASTSSLASDHCQVECSYKVADLLDVAPPDYHEGDYIAYCYSLGGGYRRSNNYCAKPHCMGRAFDSEIGYGYGANLYEARQAARKDCLAKLRSNDNLRFTPFDKNRCRLGYYSGLENPKVQNFQCH